MTTPLTSKIQVKLFAGFLVTYEWKAIFKKIPFVDELKHVSFEERDYVGVWMERDNLSVKELKEEEKRLQSEVLKIFPAAPLKALKLILFPKLFIS